MTLPPSMRTNPPGALRVMSGAPEHDRRSRLDGSVAGLDREASAGLHRVGPGFEERAAAHALDAIAFDGGVTIAADLLAREAPLTTTCLLPSMRRR
ncbi:MAG: hypothetical protein IPG04_41790 [Polyangiaceae bacterium]|nr:hypothetical protein [Polyangiaceae bacterium]